MIAKARVQTDNEPTPEILIGWKAIAAELGVTPRTAQNWERELGLRVERTTSSPHRVWILKADLDRWWSHVTFRRVPRKSGVLRSWLRRLLPFDGTSLSNGPARP